MVLIYQKFLLKTHLIRAFLETLAINWMWKWIFFCIQLILNRWMVVSCRFLFPQVIDKIIIRALSDAWVVLAIKEWLETSFTVLSVMNGLEVFLVFIILWNEILLRPFICIFSFWNACWFIPFLELELRRGFNDLLLFLFIVFYKRIVTVWLSDILIIF